MTSSKKTDQKKKEILDLNFVCCFRKIRNTESACRTRLRKKIELEKLIIEKEEMEKKYELLVQWALNVKDKCPECPELPLFLKNLQNCDFNDLKHSRPVKKHKNVRIFENVPFFHRVKIFSLLLKG